MKVLFVFGTRPEGIKMAPIIKEIQKRKNLECYTCVTGQHREMLDQVLEIFDIEPDYDLNIFKKGQSLTDVTTKTLLGLEGILDELKPDILLVQGDTTTVFAAALAAFYKKIKIGHVEAGLRSGNLYSPYPEEANRKLTGVISNYHFAPTESNRQNLIREGYDEKNIFITGNTVIDALKYSVREDFVFDDEILNDIDYNRDVVLLTAHRRENWGKPMEDIFKAIRRVVLEKENLEIVFPRHLNPIVREAAEKYFADLDRVHLIEPLSYLPFSNLMARVKFVVTDSGGVQEEAPALGKPVLVLRNETERMEGVEAKTAKLVGTKEQDVYESIVALLEDKDLYDEMARAVNPYGDGHAAEKIVDVLEGMI
ncbi:MAG: UDP-N-acetylglucosamine 2-epimerase (non-hydrolyzing) [Peptoniphilus harei]|uniref:UDP-N-acetylglucosamine 2-epimerase (non-hydrolyzing) n=1 Tax=Peptoniphilus harei ACS-146-V-Sch2b TaxID=908338 RepID=E4KZS9_9FIRM|nr:UDP-N-acetylglucosamine 2-epimerase (non-hydrolyzing) [Peptoniphilus harei]EFR32632.1 UDP-N-acetylglucosamine 2-epimerase [Peptoniphilus harei ACS-146-V-Sch2b]MDK7755624.1 UDP-N-acetylglucosamine 2-epimerase (non-hydrolyzing) [Peptoniphilus harei]MDK7761321.1 UDP-N-acetylglucosamine 2-epimerase (non-hydrolyzing) [Peptoniphilus harei]MDK8271306.1 UDP-N-acetylglucosamine 2-epimerase (non-hydrolyzing) [Peptoniphilus harei]MDK8339826.1 UDP-N-acetylglucosamine 2-epimerase (non-hydrolyzing) [Pept